MKKLTYFLFLLMLMSINQFSYAEDGCDTTLGDNMAELGDEIKALNRYVRSTDEVDQVKVNGMLDNIVTNIKESIDEKPRLFTTEEYSEEKTKEEFTIYQERLTKVAEFFSSLKSVESKKELISKLSKVKKMSKKGHKRFKDCDD